MVRVGETHSEAFAAFCDAHANAEWVRDAIHVATARVLSDDLDAIVSYDDRLLRAATEAGLPVASPRD